MRSSYLSILLLFLSFNVPSASADNNKLSSMQDLMILRERVVSELLQPALNTNAIQTLMTTIRKDGTWPGIDYVDTTNTGFQHSRHLGNMVTLARAYKKPGSKYFKNPKTKKVIHSALDFWLKNDFICQNWWWNQIGTPDHMVQLLLIMDEDIAPSQRPKAEEIAVRANLGAWGARPGGDLIKIAGIYGKFALYKKDIEILDSVVQTMAREIMFARDRNHPTDLRGLQVDYSFQHRDDRVISTLSYGLGYASSFAEWAEKLADTKFRFPEPAIQMLIDFYLDGICKTMVYGKYDDPGAKNRGITRKGALGAASTGLPEKLLKASNYRKDELETIVKVRNGSPKHNMASNQYYYHSTYFSHQRPHYFTSVRMYASRNHSMEIAYNSEGLKNHHYADGSNFISRTGKEYFDIFPVFDWQKVPGTTVVQKPNLHPANLVQRKGLTEFVGAVSDGLYGAAAFDFKSPLDSVKARKAYFLFDNEIVNLGAGIQSSADYPVATTINQSLLKSNVMVMQNNNRQTLSKGNHEIGNVAWVYHDSIAYIFPSPKHVILQNTEATGSWRSINRQAIYTDEPVTLEVFKFWLDHGIKPQNVTYEYIVVPGIAVSDIEKYRSSSGIVILANTPDVQAVYHSDLQMGQMAFYKAGEIKMTNDIQVAIDKPALVMVAADGALVKKITVADPTGKLKSIQLAVSSRIQVKGDFYNSVWNQEKGYSEIFIELPKNEYAGKSVVIKL
jgi:chondroitin AC lyase